MRLYRFDAETGRAIYQFGSAGAAITPVTRIAKEGQVTAFWIEPGGHVGAHEADVPQLLLVIHGAGWVEGANGARAPIHAWQAAYWEKGERHSTGSPGGMGALVIEGRALDLTFLKPLDPGDSGAPA